jgi:hypothetical protein
MLLTARCVFVVLAGPVVFGLPLTRLLGRRKPFDERDWVQAPFLGVAAVVLVLQNLVYLDLPVGRVAPLLWAGALGLWVWLFWRGGLRAGLARCPRAAYVACLLVYAAHAVGLFVVGARYYVGRCWNDEYNYTAMAQWFMDGRFSLGPGDAVNQPWAVPAWMLCRRAVRIGQSVLHAFFAVSSGAEAKALFEPTTLLCAPLTVLAIYALARQFRLGRRAALAAGAGAGLLPALTLIHLESFMSHALGTPLLLYLPTGLYELSKRPSPGRLGGLALVVAAIASVYAEYWLIVLGVVALMLGLAAFRGAGAWKMAGSGLVLAASPFILNPGFARGLLAIQGYVNAPVLAAVYPWAARAEGLTRLWLGDLVRVPASSGPNLARAWGLAATVLAYAGLVRAARGHFCAGRKGRLALSLGVLALAGLPWLVFAIPGKHPYQFYKVLLSVSPLLVLGLALACRPQLPGAAVRPRGWLGRLWVIPSFLVLGGTCAAALVGTTRMAVETTRRLGTERCRAPWLQDRNVREAQDRLERLRGRNLLIATPYGGANHYRNGWLAYFARHNRTWLANPWVNDSDAERFKGLAEPVLPPACAWWPEGLLVLTGKGDFRAGPLGDARRLWGNGLYELWQPGPGPWAVPLGEYHRDSAPVEIDGRLVYCLDEGVTTLEVLASTPGTLKVTGRLRRGLTADSAEPARLRVRTGDGHAAEWAVWGGQATLAVPVVAGRNVVTLTAAGPAGDGAPAAALSPGVRPEVRGIDLEFVPAPPDG